MRKEFFNTKNLKLDLYMVNCGFEDCCANFTKSQHTRKYYLIHYITKGSGYYEVGGKKYYVKSGDVFIIYPGQTVSYYSHDIDDTWSFCWLGFSGENAKEYMNLTGVTEYTKTLKSQKFYSTIMRCLEYVEENSHNISQLKLNAYINECLYHLSEIPTKHKSSAVEHVEKAIRYIEYNYMNEITIQSICEYLNIDRTYFYRIFKKFTGSSPEKYVISYRIKKARELLKERKYTISEISTFVGFKDVYYFSRVFKKSTGKSPTQYNKMD